MTDSMNINDSDLDDDLLTGQVEEQTDTPGQYEHWRVLERFGYTTLVECR